MPATINVLDATGSAVTVATLDAIATILGQVQASPTSLTVLDRLKTLATLLNGGLPATLSSGGGVKAGVVDALPAGTNVVGRVGIDQTTPGTTNKVFLQDLGDGDYETVAASQSDQVLGPTGAAGDYLAGLLIVPATTSPGAVSIKDGSGSAITVFAGGASSVSNLVPFFVPLGIKSTGGAWKVTTGANVSVVAAGNFT